MIGSRCIQGGKIVEWLKDKKDHYVLHTRQKVHVRI